MVRKLFFAVGSSHNLKEDIFEQQDAELESSSFETSADSPSSDEEKGEDYQEDDVPTVDDDDDSSTSMSKEDAQDDAATSELVELHSDHHDSGPKTTVQARQATVVRVGTLDLWLPKDDQCLTPFHCFIRKECVEAFTVSGAALKLAGLFPGRTIHHNQVGIQCKFCNHRPIAGRNEGAVSFPSSLSNIYHSIDTWHRRHSLRCHDIYPAIRAKLIELQKQSRSGVGGNRRYWETSASLLGFFNHPSGGIRFCLEPGSTDHMFRDSVTHAANNNNGTISLSTLVLPPSRPIVHSGDADTTNPFLYQLLSQMETCYYSEDCLAQAKKGRTIREIEIGSPGFQCKYCKGQRGYGRYFPPSVDALALANSDRNIYKHITKCHSCPQSIKTSLQALYHEQKSGGVREPRGSRRRFFQKVWDQMHGVDIA